MTCSSRSNKLIQGCPTNAGRPEPCIAWQASEQPNVPLQGEIAAINP